MISIIKKIPSRFEPAVLIAIAYGVLIYFSLSYISNYSIRTDYIFTNEKALFNIAYNIAMLCFVGWFLKVRGYKLGDFDWEISWILSGAGILLFYVSYLAYLVVYAAFEGVVGVGLLEQFGNIHIEAAFPLVLTVLVTGVIFEEFILSVYLVDALKKDHGIMLAIGIGVLVRLLCCVDLGPLSAAVALAEGALFPYVYWKWRKLWPLVFAGLLTGVIGWAYA